MVRNYRITTEFLRFVLLYSGAVDGNECRSNNKIYFSDYHPQHNSLGLKVFRVANVSITIYRRGLANRLIKLVYKKRIALTSPTKKGATLASLFSLSSNVSTLCMLQRCLFIFYVICLKIFSASSAAQILLLSRMVKLDNKVSFSIFAHLHNLTTMYQQKQHGV